MPTFQLSTVLPLRGWGKEPQEEVDPSEMVWGPLSTPLLQMRHLEDNTENYMTLTLCNHRDLQLFSAV